MHVPAVNLLKRRRDRLATGIPFIRRAAGIAAIVFLAGTTAARGDGEPSVRIQVLSKQVRLLREGSIRELTIETRTAGVLVSVNGTPVGPFGGSLIFRMEDQGSVAYDGPTVIRGMFRISMEGKSEEETCEAVLAGERRRYPLPFVAVNDPRGLRFFATERLGRYAWDSALAEYGMSHRDDEEAIMALAQVIRSRYFTGKARPRHGDADFCDLTHCQVYRGRLGSRTGGTGPWLIDTGNLRGNLFFHAGCGGRTLGCAVFGGRGTTGDTGCAGVRDWLYHDGTELCSGPDSRWTRSLRRGELAEILKLHRQHDAKCLTIEYDESARTVTTAIEGSARETRPAESFRLMVNRVRGWNFLKSNYYRIESGADDRVVFTGRGLGHGVGLCQRGAAALAHRGYTQYEILEHYYPGLTFTAERPDISPYLAYCIFDIARGTVIASNTGKHFLKRRIPPGSIFKIIVSLFLAAERPDLFRNHSYDCKGVNRADRSMPERCWNPRGHGLMRLRGAIAKSCNLYFASLYRSVSRERFRSFYAGLSRAIGMDSEIPEMRDDRNWAEFLSGLDFRFRLSVKDYIRLACFLHDGGSTAGTSAAERAGIRRHEMMEIMRAMRETFTSGTLSKPSVSHAHPWYLEPLLLREKISGDAAAKREYWGKTATVIDGTNRPASYGLFIGGCGRAGIVAILRGGNGHLAGRWGRMMLAGHLEQRQ